MLHLDRSLAARALVAATCVAGALTLGCRGDTGKYNGDAPMPPVPNKLGAGTHISSKLGGFYGPAPWVQPANPNSLNCPYPAPIDEIATGVTVTAVDRWDETGNGAIGTVYLQDTVGLDDWTKIPVYAGMSMFSPSFTPPDLRVLPGDVLDMTGQYEEFIGPSTGAFPQCETLPQIAGAASFRFDGQVPPPVQIPPSALASFDGAREYLSMLVTVTNVTIAANGVEKSGRYSADVQVDGTVWQISDELWDVPGNSCAPKDTACLSEHIPLNQGDTFKSITGIVTYFYGYHLAPRSLDDFDPHAAPMMDAGTDGG